MTNVSIWTAKQIEWYGHIYKIVVMALYLEAGTEKIICPNCKARGRQKAVAEIMQYGLIVDVELELFRCLNCNHHFAFRHNYSIDRKESDSEPVNSK